MERRRHPRVEVDHAVLFHSDIYRNPKVASTLDLSLGGTKIESLHSLNSQEGLEISIAIQPQVISCRGKVIYAVEREKGRIEAGIQFEGLSEPDRIYLKEYLFDLMEQRALEASVSVG